MAIYPDKSLLATGGIYKHILYNFLNKKIKKKGYQHVSIYDVNSSNQQAVLNLDGTSKNTVSIGFQEKGEWLYTAGEDKILKIWDIKSRHINCLEFYSHTQPITCVALHPNQVSYNFKKKKKFYIKSILQG